MTRWPIVVAAGLLAGTVATMAKGQAEATLQPAAEKVWPPTPAQKRVRGADPADHPDRMPPTLIAEKVDDVVTGGSSDDDTVDAAAAKLHWGMGLGSAVAYALLSSRFPRVRVGAGAPAGVALYAITHGSTLPLAGLQPYPWNMPRSAVAWEAGSHVVYGTVLELALRVQDRFLR